MSLPTGSVIAYAGVRPPAGWLLCDGSLLKPGDVPDQRPLADLLGGQYDLFDHRAPYLPNLQGRVIIGCGTGSTVVAGTSVSLPMRSNGEAYGADSIILTTDYLPQHSTHQIEGDSGSVSVDTYRVVAPNNPPGPISHLSNHVAGWYGGAYDPAGQPGVYHDANFPNAAHTHHLSFASAAAGTANRVLSLNQPSQVLSYIIKL